MMKLLLDVTRPSRISDAVLLLAHYGQGAFRVCETFETFIV